MGKLEISTKDLRLKDLKPLAIPLVIILVLVFLFVVGYRMIFGKISSERVKLAAASKNEANLIRKRDTLRELETQVAPLAESSILAVPEKNAALPMVSQLKNLANLRVLTLSGLKVAPPSKDKNDLNKVQIQFDVNGDFTQVLSFIKDIFQTAPISRIEKVQITRVGDVAKGSVSLTVYYAPYPTKLPPMTEPLKDLTADELDLLNLLSTLKPPLLFDVSASGPILRENPFK